MAEFIWARSIYGAALVALGLGYGACSGKTRPQVYDPSTDGSTGGRTITRGTGGSEAGSAGIGGGGGGTAGQDAGPPKNCGDLTCSGHSRCNPGPPAACECDKGYVEDTATGECVVDKSCINVRSLESACRQVIGGAHAVASFFSVSYCAGTAVLPADLAKIAGADGGVTGAGDAFVVKEDNLELQKSESWQGIYSRKVESYLTIAIDLSNSLTGSDAGVTTLTELTSDLRTVLLPNLSQPGEAPVGVSVLVFGANVVELVPFTTDLAAVDAGLARLATDIPTLAADVDSGTTALYRAAIAAYDGTQRIRQLRADVTENGVLTTGTVVVITDGKNDAGDSITPLTNRLNTKQLKVISVGIGGDVTHDTLDAIGPDGSFLAPTRDDWRNAFTEIAQRIDEYPNSAYLLAYCSPTTTEKHTVTVSLKNITDGDSAACTFDAALFSTNPPTCDEAFFANACSGQECGGFLACGACASSQCCAGGTCSDPAQASDCRGQNELCAPSSPAEYCNGSSCTAPAAQGESCGTCEAGEYCAPDNTCAAAFPSGTPCATAAECQSQNCVSQRLIEPKTCQARPARMFEPCSGTNSSNVSASAVCELGTNCTGDVCNPRKVWSCTNDTDCLSGQCDTSTGSCVPSATCHWNWASKMGEPPSP